MLNRVLVATDLSEHSARAEARAAILCQQLDCQPLELCTVLEAGLPESLADLLKIPGAQAQTLIVEQKKRELAERSDRLQSLYGTTCTTEVRFGYPARELAARAQEIAADLIVLGAHGSNFLSDLFLGNTTDKLIRVAKRPLLVVKNEAQQPYRKVLVASDFSDNAKHAARLALQIGPQASFTFLHAYDVWFESYMRYASVSTEAIEEYKIRARGQAWTQLDQFISDLSPALAPLRYLEHGAASSVIREYADKTRPDLIVLGKHGRTFFEALLVGSVTRDTLDWTRSDVLVSLADPNG